MGVIKAARSVHELGARPKSLDDDPKGCIIKIVFQILYRVIKKWGVFMYEKREKLCGVIAVVYYIAYWFLLLLCGKVQVLTQSRLFTTVLYTLIFVLTVAFVYRKEYSWRSLGFPGEKNTKTDLWLGAVLILAGICIKIFLVWKAFGQLTEDLWFQILWTIPYYLFYIAAVEEILFRGFIQNYLFGLNLNPKLVFCLGGIFFSLFHLPYQMYNRGFSSLLVYTVQMIPSLVFIFFVHLALCLIAKKRESIILPIVIHFLMDYL